jgi:hypothetical protein
VLSAIALPLEVSVAPGWIEFAVGWLADVLGGQRVQRRGGRGKEERSRCAAARKGAGTQTLGFDFSHVLSPLSGEGLMC